MSFAAASTSASAASAVTTNLGALPSDLKEITSITLFVYETCPFCNKLRAYLDYKGLPYVVVEVDPLMKGQLKWSKDYRKVPIAVVNGHQLNDSTNIVDQIEAVLARGKKEKMKGKEAEKDEEEKKWRNWCSSALVQNLTANIYRDLGEAMDTFDYLTQRNFPAWSVLPTKLIGGAAMTAIAAKRTKENGWDKLPGKQREALFRTINELADAAAAKGGFLGGADKPCIADVEIFGAIRSIKGLAAYNELLSPSNTRLQPWWARMEEAVGPSQLVLRIGEAPPFPTSSDTSNAANANAAK